MPEFSCKICKKLFKYKSHYHNHLQFSKCLRQFPITTINNTIKNLLCPHNNSTPHNSVPQKNPSPIHIYQEKSVNDLQWNLITTKNTKNPKEFWCECGAGFTTKSNKQRHMASCHISRNAQHDHPVPQKNNDENAKYFYGNGEKNDQKIINNYNNNITVNINYYNTSVKLNKTKVVIDGINSFGKENTTYIDAEKYKYIFNNPFSCLLKLINDIHFNQSHPENMNIKRSNSRSKFVEVLIDGEWNSTPMSTVVHTLINTKMDEMDNIVNILEPNENTIKRKKYDDWTENINNMINDLNKIESSENVRQITKQLKENNKEIYKSINNFVDNQLLNRAKLT